ncbi:MAG TPA: Mur ligase family protein [Ramlibacter sp.]
MRLVNHSFYVGPNVWFTASGLMLVIEWTREDAAFLKWKPSPAEAARMLTFLQAALAVPAEAAQSWRGETICDAAAPAIELLLSTAKVLVGDFCVKPAKGRLVDVVPQHLRLFLPCDEPGVGLPAWLLAMEACCPRIGAPGADTAGGLEELRDRYWLFRQAAHRQALNQSTIALARAACDAGIPHYRIATPGQFLQLGQGCFRQRVSETVTDRTSGLARWLSNDKFATSSFLSSQQIPTSQPQAVASAEQAVQALRRLNLPVVVKPRAAGKGRGVSVNLSSESDVVAAFEHAASFKTGVIVERCVEGDDHRLLAVGGRFIAAARRIPAHVTGDGQLTVRQLVDKLNQDPRRGMPFDRLLEWVKLDEEAVSVLAADGLALDSVPAQGRLVPLRRSANLSRGGTSVDVTDLVHPDNRALAERVAQLIGLDVTGIDFLTPDIGKSWRDVPCAILEVNASPGLRPHFAANPHRDVVRPIIDMLYPQGTASRVPTAGITGSAGKTTTCRMVAAILAQDGKTVALSTTQGTYIGADQLKSGDFAGGASAAALLRDPRVQAGVFELARGGLLKRGMAIDSCDVGAVLNVYDNHVGLNGVRNTEDLARIKRLVPENSRKMAVLNADDPLCLAMRAHLSAPVCLVTEDRDNPVVLEHRLAGGTAAVLDAQRQAPVLKLYAGQQLVGELAAAAIPATWGGAFRPTAINALYAMAIAHGMGVEFTVIAAALAKFESTPDSNPGRMNVYDHLPYRVIVTWADGRRPVAELARFVQTQKVSGTKRLLLCAVGNRPDDFLLDMGAAAASAFGHYVVSDWEDLRGRPAGATAALLAQGLTGAGVPPERVAVAADYYDGLSTAFESAAPGDLLVVVSYASDKSQRAINMRVGA